MNSQIHAASGKIHTINSGAGNYQNINYSSLLQSNLYTKGSGSTYPVIDVSPALSVVKTTYSNNCGFGATALNYTYGGAKIHLQGKGFLGMMSNKVTNSTTGITTETENRNLHPAFFIPTQTYSKTALGASYEETTTTINVVDRGLELQTFTGHKVKQHSY